jgi:ribosome-associated protein
LSTTHDEEAEDGGGRPSKSARKRAAHAAQDLGEALIGLREDELAALGLPAELIEALCAARAITSRAALTRQRQYIGRLMRGLDPQPIRAALAARGAVSAREAARFKLAERWRERLIAGGADALAELARAHPGLDTALWTQRISTARAERARGGGAATAGRELFRALRALFATMP